MPSINNISPKWITKKQPDSKGWTETGNKIYHTARWKKLRVIVLNNQPICTACNERPSVLVDHIKPIRLGGSMWSMSNLQGMCERCHNSKSGKEGKE